MRNFGVRKNRCLITIVIAAIVVVDVSAPARRPNRWDRRKPRARSSSRIIPT